MLSFFVNSLLFRKRPPWFYTLARYVNHFYLHRKKEEKKTTSTDKKMTYVELIWGARRTKWLKRHTKCSSEEWNRRNWMRYDERRTHNFTRRREKTIMKKHTGRIVHPIELFMIHDWPTLAYWNSFQIECHVCTIEQCHTCHELFSLSLHFFLSLGFHICLWCCCIIVTAISLGYGYLMCACLRKW